MRKQLGKIVRWQRNFVAGRKAILFGVAIVLPTFILLGVLNMHGAESATKGGVFAAELSFSDLSPSGIMGGRVIPASCESGLGEGGIAHYAGDTSGTCTGSSLNITGVTMNSGNVFTDGTTQYTITITATDSGARCKKSDEKFFFGMV